MAADQDQTPNPKSKNETIALEHPSSNITNKRIRNFRFVPWFRLVLSFCAIMSFRAVMLFHAVVSFREVVSCGAVISFCAVVLCPTWFRAVLPCDSVAVVR